MIEIRSRWDGRVLYTAEDARDVREALEEARSKGANLRYSDLRGSNLSYSDLRGSDLRGSDLRGSNLSGSDLRYSDLRGSNLSGSDLRGSNLSGSDLRGSDLRGSNLSGSDLRGSNLSGSDLRGSNLSGSDLRYSDLRDSDLSGANLRYSDLRGSNLSGSDLRGSDLSGAKGLHPARVNDLLMLYDQPGKIRAYKLINEHGEGIYNGGLRYEAGKTVSVEDADTDPSNDCGAGINLATLPWCIREWREGYRILICEFTADDIAAIPIGDGKFRVHRAEVVAEKDLTELGLVP